MNEGTILVLTLAAAFSFGILHLRYERPTSGFRALLDCVVFAAASLAVPFIFGVAMAASDTGGTAIWVVMALIALAWFGYSWPRLAHRFEVVAMFVGWRPSFWASLAGVAGAVAIAALIGAFMAPEVAAWVFLAGIIPGLIAVNVMLALNARQMRSIMAAPDDDFTRENALVTYIELRTTFGTNFQLCACLIGVAHETNIFLLEPGSTYGRVGLGLLTVMFLSGLPWVVSGFRLALSKDDRMGRIEEGLWPSWP